MRQNSRKSSRQSGRNNRADKRETGSLNTEQSATDRAYPTTLDKSRDTRCKQSHRNQKAGCFQIEFQRAGNDQRRSNDGHKIASKCCKAAKSFLSQADGHSVRKSAPHPEPQSVLFPLKLILTYLMVKNKKMKKPCCCRQSSFLHFSQLLFYLNFAVIQAFNDSQRLDMNTLRTQVITSMLE